MTGTFQPAYLGIRDTLNTQVFYQTVVIHCFAGYRFDQFQHVMLPFGVQAIQFRVPFSFIDKI